MATRTITPGTLTSSDPLASSEYNELPGGWIGYVAITSDVTGLTTSDDTLTGLTVTVTAGTNRYLEIHGHVRLTSDVANDDGSINIKESSTTLQGSGAVAMNRTEANLGQGYGCNAWKILSAPSAGSHTYFLTGGRAAGTGTLKCKADSTRPAYILVSDLGST